ncbi:MAG TPA: outer membrane beta-barrel protein [Verrucomicrobiae bacterium]|jgi:hypothetical protein
MKFNKWTLGLAAIGAVSLTSAARADEAKLTALNTSLSNTTISGYVDVAAQYNMGNQQAGATVPLGTSANKINSFSLNTVAITLDKPEDESPWASGYHVDLNFGQDSINQVAGSVGIRQAYVVVRTPVGNGIDWKFGVQDDIIGYEGNTDGANPNYTRSVGYAIEPTTLTGLIGTYKISDSVAVTAGLANETFFSTAPITGTDLYSRKAIATAAALTAPDSWGFLKGATLNVGALLNLENNGQNNYFAGVVVPTPLSKLKLGGAFDLVSEANGSGAAPTGAGAPQNDSGWVAGVYGNYAATDKLSLNLRGEYYDLTGTYGSAAGALSYGNGKGEELTATVAYNLWANVISRAEFRWDHMDSGTGFADGNSANSFIAAVNLIYTF